MALLRSIAGRRSDRGAWPQWRALAALTVLLLGCLLPVPIGAQPAREYQVKAVFLFNFAQFVEWPPQAFPDDGAPLVIGVLGEDPFGPALDEAVQGESIGGRSIIIRRYRHLSEVEHCHILFISRSETARVDPIVARLASRSILTVSDAEGSAHRGVMIRFFTENKRIRLRINLESARAAGLVISSKLLRPAEIVNE